MLIKGFGFSGYRSFGDELVKIGSLSKVNFVIGQNNSGKSNIINYLRDQYAFFLWKAKQQNGQTQRPSEITFKQIDKNVSSMASMHRISFPLFKDDFDDHIASLLPDNPKGRKLRALARKVISHESIFDGEAAWFTYSSKTPNGLFALELPIAAMTQIMAEDDWYALWQVLTQSDGGSLTGAWIPQSVNAFAPIPDSAPHVEVIPAIRKIGASGTTAVDFSGEGIIDRLAQIQNPEYANQNLKEKFSFINRFVQDVLENPSAEIEIPYARDMILVHMDDKTLPLDSLGTGIHEVVILAAAATLLDETLVCIEEPELHLHPLLQKKLVKYLADGTSNQYFFTTHSAHLLDAVEASIFHVTQTKHESHVERISSNTERSKICYDLGYKASDILQSNCVIWVEGPSDRVYINFWLSERAPLLEEGVHYSIMFFGGRLFSHLTALDNDEEQKATSDLISLRKLNRNTVIIFDSDKVGPRAHINKTKKRLKSEFDDGPGFTWVSKGREIENYLDSEQIEKSVKKVHPSADKILNKGEWDNLLKYRKKQSIDEKTANKVQVARHYVTNNSPDFSRLDLAKQIDHLISFIKIANL